MRIENKVAIVTGGASSIGRTIGESLALEGASVVIADIDGPGAKVVAGGRVGPGLEVVGDVPG